MPLREIPGVTLRALPALMMPVILLAGIYGGATTPTEASTTAWPPPAPPAPRCTGCSRSACLCSTAAIRAAHRRPWAATSASPAPMC
ncbi:hypothetical protein [Roseateles sp.]|uniref:hypothetical protein n=1 Tax=Roseateles sp. TaxID=1971397 RepID=UPI00286B6B49|nr:hypothetical protein [Roseateles sp.]